MNFDLQFNQLYVLGASKHSSSFHFLIYSCISLLKLFL